MNFEDITYSDIYTTVLQNKEEFEITCCAYFNEAVKPVWIEGGRKKLVEISPQGSWGVGFQRDSDFRINARKFIKTNSELKKWAFAWFVTGDMLNCNKYFKKDDIRYWGTREWKILRGDLKISEEDRGSWSNNSVGFLDLVDIHLGQCSSFRAERTTDFIKPILDMLKLSDIKGILPNGFNDYIVKNTRQKAKAPMVVSNKMQYIMWKKALYSTPMTAHHYRDMMRSNLGKWKLEGFNECFKIESLVVKRYFIDSVERNWFVEVSRANLTLSKIKLKQLSGRIDAKQTAWGQNQIIDFLENTEVSDSSGKEFLDWVRDSGVLRNIRFKERANSYFTQENFMLHLERIYC